MISNSEIVNEIKRKKAETNTVILAHTYQNPEIIDIADVTGDSYALSVAATKLESRRIIMCGVRFMADTVKILSPEKTVILARPDATCPMADMTPASEILEFKKQHPDVCVVAYVNTSTELKAVCDVCVTSSTAVKIVKNIDAETVLFVPDRNLGGYVKRQVPEKNVLLWNGCCPVHDSVNEDDILELKTKHSNAFFAVHPECRREVVRHADMVGATSGIIDYIKSLAAGSEVIVGTELGVSQYLTEKDCGRKLIQLCPEKLVCPDMKITTLTDVMNAVAGSGGEEVYIPEELRLSARKCIDNMIRYGG